MEQKSEFSGLLDTSYSKVQTDLEKKGKKIVFIPVDVLNNINEIKKEKKENKTIKYNLDCYSYFNDEYLPDLDKKMLNDLYCEYYEVSNRDLDLKLPEYPIDLYEKHQNNLEKTQNDSLLYFAEKHFLRWYRNIKNKSRYIYLKNGDKKCLKKIITRFDKRYTTMVQNRMNWLMYQYGNENACSITLTLNPANFRDNKQCMWETINKLLNEFITELRYYFKNTKHVDLKYIRCIEAMKGTNKNDFVGRGNPHIHICVFGTKYINKQKISDFWPYGFNFINSTAKSQKVRYPIHYITKYITKTYNENDPDNTTNQSLVWFFNKNSYDHTKNLIWPLYKKGDGSWICEYIVEMDPLNNDIEEMDLIFQTEENLYKKPPPQNILPKRIIEYTHKGA